MAETESSFDAAAEIATSLSLLAMTSRLSSTLSSDETSSPKSTFFCRSL